MSQVLARNIIVTRNSAVKARYYYGTPVLAGQELLEGH